MTQWFKTSKGSSLILVLLVMAGISVFILGTQRVSLLQYRQSVVSTDTLRANQSALAGIEDALLRFRFNRDAQTEEGMEVRMDLTDGVMADYGDKLGGKYKGWYQVLSSDSQTQSYPNGYTYDPSHQYYFMRMNYKVSRLGNFDEPELSTTKIEENEAVEFSGFTNSDGTVIFKFATKLCNNPIIQIQLLTNNTDSFNQITVKDKDFEYNSNLDVYYSKEVELPLFSGSDLTFSIRMRAYNCAFNYALETNNGAKFDGLITTVLSKGIYGQASVTKVAEIDRRSGRLIGIFDYNLYSKGDIAP